MVFPYFTDPALMMEWIGHRVATEPVPGGEFAVDFESAPVRGTYLVIEPPTRVVFTWGIAGNDVLPAGSSTVEVTLSADGDDTVVELVHRDLPEARQIDHQAGWVKLLANLADRLGIGDRQSVSTSKSQDATMCCPSGAQRSRPSPVGMTVRSVRVVVCPGAQLRSAPVPPRGPARPGRSGRGGRLR